MLFPDSISGSVAELARSRELLKQLAGSYLHRLAGRYSLDAGDR